MKAAAAAALQLPLLCSLPTIARSNPASHRHVAPTFQWSSRWLALLGFIFSALTMAAALASSPALSATLCLLLLALLLSWRHSLYAFVTAPRAAYERHTLSQLRSSPLTSQDGGAAAAAAGGGEVNLEERVERAAAYVHDALSGRFRGLHWAVGSASRIHAQRIHRSLRQVRGLNVAIYLLIPFWEQPSWCYGLSECGNPHESSSGIHTGAQTRGLAPCSALCSDSSDV